MSQSPLSNSRSSARWGASRQQLGSNTFASIPAAARTPASRQTPSGGARNVYSPQCGSYGPISSTLGEPSVFTSIRLLHAPAPQGGVSPRSSFGHRFIGRNKCAQSTLALGYGAASNAVSPPVAVRSMLCDFGNTGRKKHPPACRSARNYSDFTAHCPATGTAWRAGPMDSLQGSKFTFGWGG